MTIFAGASSGTWRVLSVAPVIGETLPSVEWLAIGEVAPPEAAWFLRGVRSNARYLERREKIALDLASPPLDRSQATRAALIPIKKSAAWWDLPQDERRAIFEERSHHIAACMRFMPAVARRLYHSRDLGEPFDFLTWFEYAPEHADLFEELVRMLRATEEWNWVDREVDVRLTAG